MTPRASDLGWLIIGVAVAMAACRREDASTIQLSVGNGPSDRASFVPVTSFAEYVELPTKRNELRLTVAGYEASCERFVPPGKGEMVVTITIVTPPGTAPATGTYAWAGESSGQARTVVRRAYAVPSARIGKRSHLFAPGGSIHLDAVELTDQGSVSGTMAFEFPGDATRPATNLSGRFSAGICRLNRASKSK